MYQWNDGTYISHHGVEGQKWGVRRYQNEDGSLTAAGRRHNRQVEKGLKRLNKRSEYIDKKYNIEKQSAKLGTYKNIEKMTKFGEISKNMKSAVDKMKTNEDALARLGRKTTMQQITNGTLGTLATAGAVFLTATAGSSLIFLTPAIPIGAAYVNHLLKR